MNHKVLIALIAIFGLSLISHCEDVNVLELFPEFDDLVQKVQTNKQISDQSDETMQFAITSLQQSKAACQHGSFEMWKIKATYRDFSFNYNPAFPEPPAVVWGFDFLDIDANTRIRVEPLELSRTRLRLRMFTWSSTMVYAARLRWMACPKKI